MTLLPIVERELRVAARRRQTFWLRVVLAAIALVIGGWITIFSHFSTAQTLGKVVFTALSVLAYFYALLAGLGATADCLSEEKRAGTLGLLFLTDLKGYDIVLGKMAATSLHALSGLLVMLPVMAVPLLLGGVTGAELLRVALVALNTLFFSLATGLFCSAVCREERRALGLCFGILATLTAVLPLAGFLVAHRWHLREPLLVFFLPSPSFSAVLAFDDPFSRTPSTAMNFFVSASLVHGWGWLFLVLACWLAPRTWQERAAGGRPTGWRQAWRVLLHGSPAGRRRARTRLLTENPFYWLALSDRSRTMLLWLFLGGSAALWFWGAASDPRSWFDDGSYIFTALALNTVLKCWIAGEAGWRFLNDRQSGALELVLSTPLQVKEILSGQLVALTRRFAGPVLLVVGVELLFLRTDSSTEWLAVWTAGIVMFLADMVTLAWVGMWLGLMARHHVVAWGAAVGLVCVVPWLLFGLMATVNAVGGLYRTWDLDEKHGIFLWLGIGLATDVVLLAWARRSLLGRFREVVTQQFATSRGRP